MNPTVLRKDDPADEAGEGGETEDGETLDDIIERYANQ